MLEVGRVGISEGNTVGNPITVAPSNSLRQTTTEEERRVVIRFESANKSLIVDQEVVGIFGYPLSSSPTSIRKRKSEGVLHIVAQKVMKQQAAHIFVRLQV